MKKKVSIWLCLITMVLTLTACSGDSSKVDYYGTSYSDLETVAVTNISQLAAFSQEELSMVAASVTDKLTLKLIEEWAVTTAELGEFQGLGELVVDKANGTVTVDQYVDYIGRQVVVSFVWKYDYSAEQLMVEDVNVDLVYTLGEKLENAVLNTIMGMGMVFAVLILISLIIYSMKFVNGGENARKTTAEGKAAPTASKQTSADDELLAVITAAVAQSQQADDLELVAVITAAISASTGLPTDSFVVKSITRR